MNGARIGSLPGWLWSEAIPSFWGCTSCCRCAGLAETALKFTKAFVHCTSHILDCSACVIEHLWTYSVLFTFFENFNIWQWTTRFCASSVSTRTSSTTMRIPLLFSWISSLQITKYHILDFQVSTRVWKREISRVARPTSVAFVYSSLWFPLRVLTK
jgi:hypothetical protein